MHRKVFLAMAVVCCLATAAYATPTVTAGDWVMNAGTTGNAIQILVSGGDAVQGLNFRLAIGDEVSPNQPIIASVDIVGPGTVFNGNNTGQVNSTFLAPGLKTNSTTTTSSGSVSAAGVLANVMIDVGAGVPVGVYRLGLNFIAGFPPLQTDFAGVPAILVPGTITVVPEPTSVVLGLFAMGGLCAIAIRRRRKVA